MVTTVGSKCSVTLKRQEKKRKKKDYISYIFILLYFLRLRFIVTMDSKRPLTFAEFSGIRRRQRASRDAAQEKNDAPTENEERKEKQVASPLHNLGVTLQTQELQTVILIFYAVDVAVSCVLLLLSFVENRDEYKSLAPVETFLGYATAITTLVGFVELLLIACAFGYEFLTHIGYMADSVALLFAVRCSIFGLSPAYRLLNVIKVWRLVRIVNAAFEEMEEDHEKTRRKLGDMEELLSIQKTRTKEAERMWEREVEKHKRSEETYAAQQNEIITLREALEIAAQTMARVQGYTGFDLDEYYEAEQEKIDSGELDMDEKPVVAEMIIGKDGSVSTLQQVDEN